MELFLSVVKDIFSFTLNFSMLYLILAALWPSLISIYKSEINDINFTKKNLENIAKNSGVSKKLLKDLIKTMINAKDIFDIDKKIRKLLRDIGPHKFPLGKFTTVIILYFIVQVFNTINCKIGNIIFEVVCCLLLLGTIIVVFIFIIKILKNLFKINSEFKEILEIVERFEEFIMEKGVKGVNKKEI